MALRKFSQLFSGWSRRSGLEPEQAQCKARKVISSKRRRKIIVSLVLTGVLLTSTIAVLSISRFGSRHFDQISETLQPKNLTAPSDKRAFPENHLRRRTDNRLLLSVLAPTLLLDAPTNLTVSSASSGLISLSWTAPAGSVNHYQVERSASLSGPFQVIGTANTATFNDSPPSGVHSYLYRVRTVDNFNVPSAASNMALGTTITFTDPQLYAQATEIKKEHLYDLRAAVNAVRALVPGMPAGSWIQADLYHAVVYANDIQELRNQLGDALSALQISAGAYEDSTLATGANGTLIKKIHIEQLRDRSTRGQSTSSGPADSGPDFSMARLDPMNRIGGSGEDPLSRNFNWSVPIVSVPGRAGLDLGLTLSYNSLATWTRSGSYVGFDYDGGFPAPGFRLGFPLLQPQFTNTQAGKQSYLLITPSGERVELRQVGSSGLYQAVDSSYLLLDTTTNPMKLRAADGTQLSYPAGSSLCTQVKDRNGNFLTVHYDNAARLDYVIDTL